MESYDFHALEVLESLVEARRGGETGVKQVQFLIGDPLWQAAESGAWSPDLAKVWELDPQEGLVSDCYTLNVGEGQVTSVQVRVAAR